MVLRRKAWGLVLLGLLSACGGGGGSDADIQVRFTPASVAASADKGVAGTQVLTVDVTANGVNQNNLFFDGDGGDAVLADAQVLSQQGTSVTLQLVFRSDLPAGTYSDRLRLLLCRDPGCASQYAGSPVVLPLSYEVRPILEVAPQLQLSRRASDPTTRVATPIVLPSPQAQVLAETTDSTGLGLITARIEQGQLVVEAGHAPPGQYSAAVRLQTQDGRYFAQTSVFYTVEPVAEGSTQISFSEPLPRLEVPQGGSVSRAVTVQPPNWSPELTLKRVDVSSLLGNRFQVVALGGGRFEYRFDSAGLEPGDYGATVVYGSSLGNEQPQSVLFSVGTNLAIEPVSLTLTSQTSVDELTRQSAVTMADGRALTWQVDPASVPAWMTVLTASGQTGRDSLRFTVDPLRIRAGDSLAASLRVTVPDALVTPATAVVQVDDRLPRLVASLTPVLEQGQVAVVTISGHFPEDVTANGKLELSGAGGALRREGNVLTGQLVNLVPGVPVQLRLRYPAAQTALSIPVVAASQSAAPAVFPLAFGQQRPPVYSARHQSFYFLAEGALQRLVNRDGTWERHTASAPGALDLALSLDQDQLLVLGPQGIARHDPVSLAAVGTFTTFAPGTVSNELATSRNKHLVTTMRGTVAWVTDGTRCDGRMWQMFDLPGAVPELVSLECNGTTSMAGLATSRDHRYLMLFQNDQGKSPLVSDTLTQLGGRWPSSTVITHLGVATMDWSSPSVMLNNGTRFFVSLLGGSISTFPEAVITPFNVPAGMVPSGFGVKPSSPSNLVYAYRRGTDGAANPQALDPTLLNYGLGPSAGPAGTEATMVLPQPVGCLAGRPADEPCDHRAHVLTDMGGRHALILGPQAAMVVPLNALVPTVQALGAPRSLLRGRVQRAGVPGR